MKKECFDLLSKLVALRPVSAEPEIVAQVQAELKALLEANGIFCVIEKINDRDVLFASTTGNKTPDILFNAHVDVVPASVPEQYELKIEDGKIYGRGAADDLGNALSIAYALIALKGRADAGAIFTSDEEIGGFTTKGMVDLGYGAKKMAIVADGNTAPDKIVYAQKGILILKLTARGSSGHSSRPWLAENAIDKLLTSYAKLSAIWNNPVDVDDWRASLVPCIISGGKARNQVPDEASLVLNIRVVTAEEFYTLPEKIAEITGLEVARFDDECLPYTGNPESPEFQLLADVIREQCGITPSFMKMTGATDARHLQALGIPIAILGCNGAGVHSECEYISENAVEQLTDIFVGIALRL